MDARAARPKRTGWKRNRSCANESTSAESLSILPRSSVDIGFLARPFHELLLRYTIDRPHLKNRVAAGFWQSLTREFRSRSTQELRCGIVDRARLDRDCVALTVWSLYSDIAEAFAHGRDRSVFSVCSPPRIIEVKARALGNAWHEFCMRSEHFEPVTVAEIRVLVASLYEPHPRIWEHNRWACPNCLTKNASSTKQCSCGISRDGLPEFCERDRKSVLARSF